jgi:hypothetical protein
MPPDQAEIALAKLAAIHKTARAFLAQPSSRYFDPAEVSEYFVAVASLMATLRLNRPEFFGDVPVRAIPLPTATTDFDGRGYIERRHLGTLVRDLDYVFEVNAGSRAFETVSTARPHRVFISHGSSPDWREVQSFVERDQHLHTLELAQEPNRGRTVLQKLTEESERCSFAVIVMSGDDVGPNGIPHARENVMHEIGFFQGKYGVASVALLYQEGTNIPSNIDGLVYIPYPKELVSATFGTLSRELTDFFARLS